MKQTLQNIYGIIMFLPIMFLFIVIGMIGGFLNLILLPLGIRMDVNYDDEQNNDECDESIEN